MQACTLLQADNHASTPLLSFFIDRMPFLPPNQQHQSTEGKPWTAIQMNSLRINRNLIVTDIFDCVADNADSHVNQISRRHFKHRLGKLLAILIDLLQQRPTLSTLPHAYRRNISARNTIKILFTMQFPLWEVRSVCKCVTECTDSLSMHCSH